MRPNPTLQPLSAELLDFFARRGISAATLQKAGVMQERIYAPPLREMADTIAFAYRRRGQLINVKYRTVDKKFWQARARRSTAAIHCYFALAELCAIRRCYLNKVFVMQERNGSLLLLTVCSYSISTDE